MKETLRTQFDKVLGRLLGNITRRLREGKIRGEDALDEIAMIDPETELGRALTDLMVRVSALDLLDHYMGFSRDENVVKVYFLPEAKEDSLKKLRDDTIANRRKYIVGQDLAPVEILGTKLFRTEADPKESNWVLEMTIEMSELDTEPDLDLDIPVQAKLSGKVTPEKGSEAEAEPESEEEA